MDQIVREKDLVIEQSRQSERQARQSERHARQSERHARQSERQAREKLVESAVYLIRLGLTDQQVLEATGLDQGKIADLRSECRHD